LTRASRRVGGVFSVPLSFGLPRPEFLRHAARWSPDFPPLLPPKLRERRPPVLPESRSVYQLTTTSGTYDPSDVREPAVGPSLTTPYVTKSDAPAAGRTRA